MEIFCKIIISLLINLKPPCWQKNYYFIKEILTDPFWTVAYIHINEDYSGGEKNSLSRYPNQILRGLLLFLTGQAGTIFKQI